MDNKKNLAIKLENISKCYRIGLQEDTFDNLAETVSHFIKSPLNNFRKYRSLYKFEDLNPAQDNVPSDIIWALRDVSFEVEQGEIVGLIGLNGAGKSTLLKILSKITYPTSGRATIRGRISSLLEVGTGFHPELTGRENVYLNGTILGMRRKEIDKKFDEIVDFSAVEKFIDTPVKRYSSGMKVRLAFAVAAHLEPEILLIDEVLAVGDVRFQKKCLNKMQDVGQQGRTVLFVSHNMRTVTRLCPRTILLNGGRVQVDGPAHRVVSAYMNSDNTKLAERKWTDLMEAPGDEVVRLCAVRARTEEGLTSDVFDIRLPVGIEIEYEVLQPGHALRIRYHVYNAEGIKVFQSLDNESTWLEKPRPPGRYVSTAWVPGNLFSEGEFSVAPVLKTINPSIQRFRVDEAIVFQIIDDMNANDPSGQYAGHMGGVVRPLLKWETQFKPNASDDIVETMIGEANI